LQAGAIALDFDTDTGDIDDSIELFGPDGDVLYSVVHETKVGNAAGKGFNQIDMPLRGEASDSFDDFCVADNLSIAIRVEIRCLAHHQVDIDADALRCIVLMVINPNFPRQNKVPHEYPVGPGYWFYGRIINRFRGSERRAGSRQKEYPSGGIGSYALWCRAGRSATAVTCTGRGALPHVD